MNGQEIFVTSDLHLDHKNLIDGLSDWDDNKAPRYFDSVEHMNSTIIDRINETVRSKDILYIQGDVAMGAANRLPKHISRIRCNNINLIYGNHDKMIRRSGKLRSLFTSVQDYKVIRIDGQKIVMSHFPFITWDGIHRGSIQLYGHCHGNLSDTGKRQMDIGVDTNNYYPYRLSKVIETLNRRSVICADDHHK
jgi:calcineurin-like phosphoesterase family protein